MSWWKKFIKFLGEVFKPVAAQAPKPDEPKKEDAKPLPPVEEKKPVQDFAPWMAIARGELGTKEVPGSGDNPRVIEYHKVTSLKATEDSVPWCSSFACWVMEAAGIRSPRSARAKDWAKWGKALSKPQPGCVVVFTRDGGGHVAFFVREEGESLVVLGGNQSDAVNESKYPKSRVISYRWPV
jgi:uncharacterized protein (TIGR02594 family)